MMKLSARNYLLPFLLLPLLLMSGCIKEDFTDCPTGLKVYFSYAHTGINPGEVDRIDLYVFDRDGILRGIWCDESPVLTPEYYISLPGLPEGDYQFIAWDGLHGCYSGTPTHFVVGQTTIAEAQLALDHLSGEIPAGLPALFHAAKTETIKPIREQKVIMPLTQLHNIINITTEGLPSNGDTYRFTITDCNGTYNFDSSFAPDADFNYTTPCTKDVQGQLSSTLTVLKLAADRQPQLTIYNETHGYTLYTEDLVKLLNAMGADYDTTHVFNIHLKFNTDATVNVMVNGWLVIENGEIILI